MRQNIQRAIDFLWATAIGGLFFLLPLAVLFALLGRVYAIVASAATPLRTWLPFDTPLHAAILFVLAIAILILVCFLAGMFARRAIGRKFSNTLEKRLIMVFPKYAIYKDILAGNIVGGHDGPSLKTVLLSSELGERIAFETDRLPNGMAVVYLPGAPDAWIGSIVIVPEARVRSTEISFNEAVGILERLGRDSKSQLASISTSS